MVGLKPTLSFLIMALLLTAAAHTQVQPRPAAVTSSTGSIGGTVTAEGTGAPLRRARVTLRGGTLISPRSVDTDLRGQYTFPSLAAGTYRIEVDKPGFVTLQYGVTSSSTQGAPIALGSGASLTADVVLPRGAALEGTITDRYGEPLTGATVVAERVPDPADGRAGIVTGPQVLTDDLGHFRIHSLPAGVYYVRATLKSTSPSERPNEVVYLPGTTDIGSARAVTVGLGEEITGVNFGSGSHPQDQPVRPTNPLMRRARPGVLISGLVTSAASGTPIRDARVSLVSYDTAVMASPVTTDANGRYEITAGYRGRYHVAASAPGFVGLQYGQRRPSDPATELEVTGPGPLDAVTLARPFESVNIALPRPSAIEGIVVDEFGEPLANVIVTAARREYLVGGARLMPMSPPATTQPTDDRGHFRITVSVPGDYYLTARAGGMMEANATGGFGLTYYPATLDLAAAQRVRVDVGQDVMGLTLPMVPAEMATVSGILTDANGPLANGRIYLSPRGGRDGIAPWTLAITQMRTNADGSFTFRNVPPGSYVLQGYMGDDKGWSSPTLFAATNIDVNGVDHNDLFVNLRPGHVLRGRVVFDDTSGVRPDPATVIVQTNNADLDTNPTNSSNSDTPLKAINADGTFSVPNQFGNRVVHVVFKSTVGRPMPSDWSIRRVTLAGRDVTDEGINFQFGDVNGLEIELMRSPAVTGKVFVRSNVPASRGRVQVFSTDPAKWHANSRFMRLNMPLNSDGSFRVSGMPAGEYLVIALTEVPDNVWAGIQFLEPLVANATRISLSEGQTTTVELPLIRTAVQ